MSQVIFLNTRYRKLSQRSLFLFLQLASGTVYGTIFWSFGVISLSYVSGDMSEHSLKQIMMALTIFPSAILQDIIFEEPHFGLSGLINRIVHKV